MMRNFVAILCLSVAIVLSGFVRAEGQTQTVPVIEVKNPTHDFDQVVQGEVVRHDFRVFNRGKAELKIQHVSPD
jgi:hypothetical protein